MGKEVLSSVWLVPTEEAVKKFQPVIDGLSKRYGAIPFLPHITIWSAVASPLSVIEETSRDAIAGIEPFSVEVEKIDYATEWVKTLFAQIKPHPLLNEINRRLGQRFSHSPHPFNPHLALVYKKEMTEEEKLKEIPNIHIPQSFTLDRIAVTVFGDPVAKWENIAMWTTPFLIRFGS